MNNCEFCEKMFSTKGNLLHHQRTAKYCKSLQNVKNTQNKLIIEKNNKYKCSFCSKDFTSNQNFTQHIKICQIKKDSIISSQEKLIREQEIKLQEKELKINEQKKKLREKDKKIKELIEQYKIQQPIVVNNNIHQNNNQIQTPLNLNDVSRIRDFLDQYLDKEVLSQGQRGVARCTVDKFLKDKEGKLMYKCVDSARHNFEFMDEHGNIERDVKATKLKNLLVKGEIRDRALEIGPQLWTNKDGTDNHTGFDVFFDKVQEVANINLDDSRFRAELAALAS